MMESLHLPEDLHWEGKTEPLSPSQIASTSFEELQLFEDNFAENNFLIDDAIFLNSKIAEFEIFELNDFNDNIIKEDQWLDDKIDPAFADDFCPEPIGFYPIKQTNTDELLREFESVYDAVEYTHLTPPQTPPECKQHEKITSFEQQPILLPIYPIDEIPIQFQANFIPAKIIEKQFPSEDLFASYLHDDLNADEAFNAQELEEIVRTRAKDIADWNNDEDDDDDDDSFGADDNSSNLSSRSCLSPHSDISFNGIKNSSIGDSSSRANSSCGSLSSQDDDEWCRGEEQQTRNKTITKRKSKTRSTEDRKSRKKEQNKNAATRYRQKKKQEIEVILGEERVLHDKNRELQTSYNDIRREIKYLKNLMRELYKAKGVLK